jgi:hypothetical protein
MTRARKVKSVKAWAVVRRGLVVNDTYGALRVFKKREGVWLFGDESVIAVQISPVAAKKKRKR